VRRTRLVGAQAELFPNWRYHAFATDRVGTTVWLDQDHRRHAVVELCIRDLKSGVGLRHCPSGKFNANAAWLLAATLAHNLLRWVAAIGLGARGELVVAKTLRRTLLSMPGRITRSARRCTLHLPAGWPWAAWFELTLARLRCIPTPDPPLPHSAQPQARRAGASPPQRGQRAARSPAIASRSTGTAPRRPSVRRQATSNQPHSTPTRQEFRRRWIQAQLR
jgi:Transposase DDE domain group 1